PGALTSGTVTLRVPSSTVSVSAPGCTYTSSTKTVSCPTGALGVQQSTVRTVRATQGGLTFGLPLVTTAARAASSPADPNPANDLAMTACLVVTGLIILC